MAPHAISQMASHGFALILEFYEPHFHQLMLAQCFLELAAEGLARTLPPQLQGSFHALSS